MADEKELYDLLTMLDRLEELREDLEEFALRGGSGGDDDLDEGELRAEMEVLGVRTLSDVERRIAELNAQLDALDPADAPAEAEAE